MDEKKEVAPKKVQPVASKKPALKKAAPKKVISAAEPKITKKDIKEPFKGIKPLSPLGSL